MEKNKEEKNFKKVLMAFYAITFVLAVLNLIISTNKSFFTGVLVILTIILSGTAILANFKKSKITFHAGPALFILFSLETLFALISHLLSLEIIASLIDLIFVVLGLYIANYLISKDSK